MRRGNAAPAVLAAVFILIFLSYCVAGTFHYIQFNRQCAGFLKQAGDSNTVELARKRLQIAVDYIEKNDLTSGYTSVLYTTPGQDVGFWYSNLREALDEISSVDENATQLERSNVLMKLRETLLDDTSNGVDVTVPSGISLFPSNVLFAWWGGLSFVLGFISLWAAGRCFLNSI